MTPPHEFYLGLGSNIEPEVNLRQAIESLQGRGTIEAFSSVWESAPVGSDGPNFLNLCVRYMTDSDQSVLKSGVLNPIESRLGRTRSDNRNAPRTIDIDILMVDGASVNAERWSNAFVVVPMAELLPESMHPLEKKRLSIVAAEAQSATWIIRRPGLLKNFGPRAQPTSE
jgi:2-amino-4-hydroxy-6-hydroxymethyldihydropteridine diphosphokinase